MTEATTGTEIAKTSRRSSRPANGNAADTDTERAKFELIADKAYRALMCAREFASPKAKDDAHTVLRFTAEGDTLTISAHDGRMRTVLRVPVEYCTKPTSFSLKVRRVPAILKLLGEIHREEREKIGATITVGERSVLLAVDGATHRVPFTPPVQGELEVGDSNPVKREPGVYLATTWPVPPATMTKFHKAMAHVASSLDEDGPRAPDSPQTFHIREGKGGISGFGIVAPHSIAAPEADDDDQENPSDDEDQEELDIEDEDNDDDGDDD